MLTDATCCGKVLNLPLSPQGNELVISFVVRGEHERPRRRAEEIVTERKTPADRLWDGILAIVTGLTVAVVGALLVYFGTPLIEAQLRAPSCEQRSTATLR
jgi:hypothetical protein